MSPGIFIALEGLDGAGTTTQAQRLTDHLRSQGRAVHLTCEPGTGEIGRLLRRYLSGEIAIGAPAMAMLFAADRLDHLDSEITPALESGATVISDRYLCSSLAYQSGAAGLNLAWVDALNGFAPHAALTIYLRVSPEVAGKRLRQRAGTAEIYDAIEQQERICRKYDEIFGYRQGMALPATLGLQRGENVDAKADQKTHKALILNGELEVGDIFSSIVMAVEKEYPGTPNRGTIMVGGE